jgi:hypothetical protein
MAVTLDELEEALPASQEVSSTRSSEGTITPRSAEALEAAELSSPDIPTGTRKRLYISHFLSTWNSRLFEFGAILFLASIFPGTLLPASIYALARSSSAIVLAPAVGRYIDVADRLSVVRLSIGTSCSSFPSTRTLTGVSREYLC